MQEDASTCEMQQSTRSTAVFRMRRAADGTRPAACAKHCTRQPVRNSAHTDAAHKMQHHHSSCAAAGSKSTRSTCEMQQATRSTAVFCVRQAADGTQPAACAKHCMRQPVRNTAQTDAAHKMQHHHTTCAAAGSKSTRSRQHALGHAMHEMRRTRCFAHLTPVIVQIVGIRQTHSSNCREAAVQTAGWVSARRSMNSSVPPAPGHAAGAVCRGLLSRISPSSASNRSRKIRRLGCLSGPGLGRATLSRDARRPRTYSRPHLTTQTLTRIHTPREHADVGAAHRHRAGPHARTHARTHTHTQARTLARPLPVGPRRARVAPVSAARRTACGLHADVERTQVPPTRASRTASAPLTGEVSIGH
jgi:hypothetical protein